MTLESSNGFLRSRMNKNQHLLPSIPSHNNPGIITNNLTTAANSCTSADTIVGGEATFSNAVIAATSKLYNGGAAHTAGGEV